MRLAPLCALAFTLGVASLPAVAADGADPLSKAIAAITGKEPAATAPAAKTAVIPSVAPPAAPAPVAQPTITGPVVQPVAKIAPPPAAPEPAAEPAPEPPRPMPMGQKLEDKLQAAHERLHLSSTQEAAWGDVNKVLQENQKAAGAIFKERAGNAVDAVRQGIKAAETRISNLKRLGGVLEKFYASLTEAQQRVLDEAVLPPRQ
ncbi:MAG: Spy/CpxP family protein refolding chaperone [Alphaproteobacteria bacterium]|nr:Spy/CpxP family protein refolding chaperone [Alphaproteobacteria bacterium]